MARECLNCETEIERGETVCEECEAEVWGEQNPHAQYM